MFRPGPGHLETATRWAAVLTVVLSVGTWVPLLFADGQGGDQGGDGGTESALGATSSEWVLLVAAVPVLFGLTFVLSLLILRCRARRVRLEDA